MDIGLKTDIHCHILPGVDDGSRDTESSLVMLRAMADRGVQTPPPCVKRGGAEVSRRDHRLLEHHVTIDGQTDPHR